MEYLTKKSSIDNSDKSLQDKNEPKFRDETPQHVRTFNPESNPDDEAILRQYTAEQSARAEREERNEIEAGRASCFSRFGIDAPNDEFAKANARFDKNDTSIQALEFYRFSDPEIGKYGYF